MSIDFKMDLSAYIVKRLKPPMLMYASRTGTKKNLEALRKHGWRLLVSATGIHQSEGFPYAIDNGAWTAFQQNRPFDEGRFRAVLSKLGSGADWVIAPDIVAGGVESLRLTERWLPELVEQTPEVLIAVQDGMCREDVAPLVGPRVGIAIGGSTGWKEQALMDRTFSDMGCRLHVLRVNTARRIRLCHWANADSFDGTAATRFAKNAAMLAKHVREGKMPW